MLMLDDRVIEYYFGQVNREIHHPRRHGSNPIMVPEHPWEGSTIAHGSVIYDAKNSKYRLWYQTYRFNDRWEEMGHDMCECGSVCYAESSDGLKWEKPDLGVIEFNGSKANNIIFDTSYYIDYPSVLIDEDEPDPAKRYKMTIYLHKPGNKGLYLFTSADGIVWSEPERLGIPNATDTTVLFRSPVTKDYLILTKYHDPKRVRTLLRSADLVHFAKPEIIMTPDERDPDACDLYFLSVEPYDGAYIGLVGLYHYTPGKEEIDVQLAYSDDAMHWRRAIDYGDPTPFFGLGAEGEFDHKMVDVLARALVVKEDMVQMFYAGFRERHDISIRDQYGAFGLAELRRDGFLSVNCGSEGGGAITEPYQMDLTKPLHINADCQPDGQLTVEAIEPDSITNPKVVASAQIKGDSVNHSVALQVADGQCSSGIFRLRLTMKNSKLFSFWI